MKPTREMFSMAPTDYRKSHGDIIQSSSVPKGTSALTPRGTNRREKRSAKSKVAGGAMKVRDAESYEDKENARSAGQTTYQQKSSTIRPLSFHNSYTPKALASGTIVAFGRSVSKERIFAEEKKFLEMNVGIADKNAFEASTRILKDPMCNTPKSIKKAMRAHVEREAVPPKSRQHSQTVAMIREPNVFSNLNVSSSIEIKDTVLYEQKSCSKVTPPPPASLSDYTPQFKHTPYRKSHSINSLRRSLVDFMRYIDEDYDFKIELNEIFDKFSRRSVVKQEEGEVNRGRKSLAIKYSTNLEKKRLCQQRQRSKSLSSAYDRTHSGSHICNKLAHSTFSLTYKQKHSATCRYQEFQQFNVIDSKEKEALKRSTSVPNMKPVLLLNDGWQKERTERTLMASMMYKINLHLPDQGCDYQKYQEMTKILGF